jgi:hypothetical protein
MLVNDYRSAAKEELAALIASAETDPGLEEPLKAAILLPATNADDVLRSREDGAARKAAWILTRLADSLWIHLGERRAAVGQTGQHEGNLRRPRAALVGFKFIAATFVLWFPFTMLFGMAEGAIGLPDTVVWLWIGRCLGAMSSACLAWAIAGAEGAESITQWGTAIVSLATSLCLGICMLLGVGSVIGVFVKDANWLTINVWSPYVLPANSLALLGFAPLALILMFFRRTRGLGSLGVVVLTYFFGYTLWLYSLMVTASLSKVLLVIGLLLVGVGVIPTAVIAAVVSGQWAVAASIVTAATVIVIARVVAGYVLTRYEERFGREHATEDG